MRRMIKSLKVRDEEGNKLILLSRVPSVVLFLRDVACGSVKICDPSSNPLAALLDSVVPGMLAWIQRHKAGNAPECGEKYLELL